MTILRIADRPAGKVLTCAPWVTAHRPGHGELSAAAGNRAERDRVECPAILPIPDRQAGDVLKNWWQHVCPMAAVPFGGGGTRTACVAGRRIGRVLGDGQRLVRGGLLGEGGPRLRAGRVLGSLPCFGGRGGLVGLGALLVASLASLLGCRCSESLVDATV